MRLKQFVQSILHSVEQALKRKWNTAINRLFALWMWSVVEKLQYFLSRVRIVQDLDWILFSHRRCYFFFSPYSLVQSFIFNINFIVLLLLLLFWWCLSCSSSHFYDYSLFLFFSSSFFFFSLVRPIATIIPVFLVLWARKRRMHACIFDIYCRYGHPYHAIASPHTTSPIRFFLFKSLFLLSIRFLVLLLECFFYFCRNFLACPFSAYAKTFVNFLPVIQVEIVEQHHFEASDFVSNEWNFIPNFLWLNVILLMYIEVRSECVSK